MERSRPLRISVPEISPHPIQDSSRTQEPLSPDLAGESADAQTGEVIDPALNEASYVQPPVYETPGDQPEHTTPPSKQIFQEIGGKLRGQREGLGLSLAEVERYTRLRQHYIQALEDGLFESLPSPVQGRGMLSNYATFLNMDEDALLLRFAEGLQARRIERLPKPEPQSLFNNKKRRAVQAPLWRRFLTPDLIFGVGVAAIILFFALWTLARINNAQKTETVPTPPGISEILLTASKPTNQTSGTPQVGTALSGAEISGTPDAAGEAPLTTPASPAEISVDAPTESVSTPTLPPMNKDPLQVYIVARQRAWLRIIADNKVKFLGRTVPGNAYAFSGNKQIEMSTGNAAALQVFYNQKDLGPLGIEGEVVNLIFAPDAMMTPTPAFTATFTPSPPATITPLPSPTPRATPTITPFVPK